MFKFVRSLVWRQGADKDVVEGFSETVKICDFKVGSYRLFDRKGTEKCFRT